MGSSAQLMWRLLVDRNGRSRGIGSLLQHAWRPAPCKQLLNHEPHVSRVCIIVSKHTGMISKCESDALERKAVLGASV